MDNLRFVIRDIFCLLLTIAKVCFSSTVFAGGPRYTDSVYTVQYLCKKEKSSTVDNLPPQNLGSIINYFQLSTEAARWGTPSCSLPQPATDNGFRDGRSNWLVAPPTLYRAVPPELHVLHVAMLAINHKTCCNQWGSNGRPSEYQPHALPVWWSLRVYTDTDSVNNHTLTKFIWPFII